MSSALSSNIALPRSHSAVLLALCSFGAVALIAWPFMLESMQALCVGTDLVPEHRCIKAPNKLLGYVAIIAAFPAILLLERLWPAAHSQPRFSSAVLVDFLWFLFSPIFLVAFIMPIEEGLRWVQTSLFGPGVLFTLHALPAAAQIAIVVILSDFLFWLAHVIRHKSSLVWEFHKIHHAQEELNYFSAARVHPLDSLTVNLVRFAPFALIEADYAIPAFVIWNIFIRLYAMYTHSNIRLNMGPLKYLLVTPQSHRVHHSDLPEHQDKNFANVFSVWDFIFGTQCRDFDVYPATGIEDKNVPRPRDATVASSFGAFTRMLWYPLAHLRRGSKTSKGH